MEDESKLKEAHQGIAGRNKASKSLQEMAFSSRTEAGLIAAKDAHRMRHDWEKEFGDCTDLSEERKAICVRSLEAQLEKRVHAANHQIYGLGRILSFAERILKGHWTKWVEETKILKVRTAHNYKNVYESCLGRPELVEWFKPTTLYVICSARFPQGLKEFLLENADGVHPATAEEVLVVGELVRTGKIGLDDEKVLNLVRSKRRMDYVERVQREFRRLIARINVMISVLREIGKENRPEPMLPPGEKDTYPVKNAIGFLQGLKLSVQAQSDGYELGEDDFHLQPLQICKDCRYRDDAMTDGNLDYRVRHPDDPTLEDATEDLAAIDADIEGTDQQEVDSAISKNALREKMEAQRHKNE